MSNGVILTTQNRCDCKRWEIETYIGIIKKNYKYDIVRLKNNDQIDKIKLIEQFNIINIKLFILNSLKSNYDNNLKKLSSSVNKKFNQKNNDMRKNINKNKHNDLIKSNTYDAKVYINFSNYMDLFYDEAIIVIFDEKIRLDLFVSLNKSIKH